MSNPRKWWLLVTTVIVVGIAWLATHYIWTTKSAIEALEQTLVFDELNDRQQKVVDILVERNKLMVSLCTLIIGGTVGILIAIVKDIKGLLSGIAWTTLALSWFSLAGSILSGYKHYEGLGLMLTYKFFEPFAAYFTRWSELQFWLFLLGLFFSVIFLLRVYLDMPRGSGETK